jgi:hypothetical protein
MSVLDNLTPAEPIQPKRDWRPGIEFDGETGQATTPGYDHEPQNFDEFLLDAGLDPAGIEVIPPVRTSRWQQQKDGELVWLTSYRFTFRRKGADFDLPLAFSQAKKQTKKPKPAAKPDEALVVLWSDLQVGKVDHRGGLDEFMQRVTTIQDRLVKSCKGYGKVIFIDLGDTVENFDNKAKEHQLQSNSLSLMDQIDLATTLAWETLAKIASEVPEVLYASVGSNHCQWRVNGKAVGKATDDWGVFIGRQLARLAQQTQTKNISFVEPQEWDESLAVDVFGDGFHILGIVHGHQVRQPHAMKDWLAKQMLGSQPVSAANVVVHGHFHHQRLQEAGAVQRNHQTASRYIIGASTIDNGSNWYRNLQGDESKPGLTCLSLSKGQDYTGTVWKITDDTP